MVAAADVTFAILGCGRWTEADGPPDTKLVQPMLRRRLSPLTAAMAHATAQAARASGADLGTIATVFGSTHGETSVLRDMLVQLTDEDAALSPIAFAGSVHNTAAGVVSISTNNHGFATSLGAGHDTLAACILEALGLMHAGHADVMVVVGDLSEPEPLVPEAQRAASLAAAFHLRRGGPLRLGRELCAALPLDGPLGRSPVAGALALIDGLARALPVVRLDNGQGSGWSLRSGPA